jgi:thioredoxin reductase (NADPH)
LTDYRKTIYSDLLKTIVNLKKGNFADRIRESVAYDILVIGGGPAGISMAVEARFAGIPTEKVLIIEKSDRPCWSIRNHYPDNKIVTANYKGYRNVIHDGVMRIPDLTKPATIRYMHEAIYENDLNIRFGETVQGMEPNENGGLWVTTDRRKYECRVCIVAIGILGRPNRPDYRLPRTLKGRIHFEDPSFPITDSDILIVGGGDTAAERAIQLRRLGNDVTISYRGADFHRMNDENLKTILTMENTGELTIWLNSDIIGLERDGGRPRVSFVGDSPQPVTFDHVFYCLGGSTPTAFLKNLGIEFDGGLPVMKDGFETSIPGLFLAGDLTAGRDGGSINWAFAASRRAMQKIAGNYLADVAAG